MRFAIPALLLALAACDSADPLPPAPTGVPVAADVDSFGVRSGLGIGLTTQSSSTGDSETRPIYFRGSIGSDDVLEIYLGALWLSGDQSGQRRLARTGSRRDFAYCPGESQYFLSGDVDYALGDWPVSLDAPLAPDGGPLVYGDAMMWSPFCIDPNADTERQLQDVRVATAVFAYDDLPDVNFLRFEIANIGSEPIEEFRAGFYADYDMGGFSGYGHNLVGGDGELTFVYVDPDHPSDVAPDPAAGVALLETPGGGGLDVRRLIYRVRGGTTAEPQLDNQLSSIEDVLNTLDGLYKDGTPIIDPTTGSPTTLMFGGDPISGTGWIDGDAPGAETGADIRLLTAAAPTTLAPGERTVLTVMVTAANEGELASSLNQLRSRTRAVAADPVRWQFPVAE